MARNCKRTKSKLPQYKFGDWLKDEALPFVGDSYKRTADTALSLVGANNVINEDSYKTNFFKKTDKAADTVANVGGQVVGGLLLPGMGDKAVGGLQKGIGQSVGDPVGDRQAKEDAQMQQRYNLVAQKNLELQSQFPYGGNLDATGSSIKGVLMEGLDDRYNSTRNRKQKKYYKGVKDYLFNQMDNDFMGKEEFEFYKNDPNLKDYISDPATLGRLKKKGFDFVEPNKELSTLAEGGFIRNYKGNTHEDGGIPVDELGNPIERSMAKNEVEGKEVEVKFPKDESPYIFSERLGFADKAKKVQRKYSKRKNDPISTNAMYEELGRLKEDQEMVREVKRKYHEEKLMEYGGDMYANGGSIHIKPENRSKFTAYKERTGKTTEEALHSPNAHVRQMANFARNARKWKHADGGGLGSLEDYTNFNFNNYSNGLTNFANTDPSTYTNSLDDSTQDYKPYSGNYVPNVVNAIGNIGGIISSKRAEKNLGSYRTPDYMPEMMDLIDAIRMEEEAGTRRSNSLRTNIRDFSPAQRAAIISSYDDGETRKGIRDLEFKEKNTNIGLRNEARKYNLEKNTESSIRDKEAKEFYRQERMGYLNNILNNVSQASNKKENYDTASMLSDNYYIVKDPKQRGQFIFIPKSKK